MTEEFFHLFKRLKNFLIIYTVYIIYNKFTKYAKKLSCTFSLTNFENPVLRLILRAKLIYKKWIFRKEKSSTLLIFLFINTNFNNYTIVRQCGKELSLYKYND